MSPEPKHEYTPGPPDEPRECPVCDQEYSGVCPLRSSDCPFAYDEPPKDIDLDDEDDDSSLLPDFGLDDDFDDSEEDDEDEDLFGDLDLNDDDD